MRFVLFSDVHGNLTALDAFARQLDRHQPLDAVIVAGDLLWGVVRRHNFGRSGSTLVVVVQAVQHRA